MEFEWDAKKAKANLRKHRVSFLEASTALVIRFRRRAGIPTIPPTKNVS
jgi:uncharacterized DUF497 family protein